MGKKLESCLSTKSDFVPGPGNYEPNPNVVANYGGHTKFGKSKREGIYNEKAALFVPSPFAYK